MLISIFATNAREEKNGIITGAGVLSFLEKDMPDMKYKGTFAPRLVTLNGKVKRRNH